MRKTLFVLVPLVLMVSLVMIAQRGATAAWRRATGQDWPAGLGSLRSVPDRYPSRTTNAAALELLRLAGDAGIQITDDGPSELQGKVSDYVRSQVRRSDASIDPAPGEVKEFLDSKNREVAALRSHLLGAGEIVWDFDLAQGSESAFPKVRAQMQIARLLTANALDRARTGDPGAWDDLHAAWNLTPPLWQRPDLLSCLVSFGIARQVVAASRMMPLPVPSWFDEPRRFDYRRQMAQALQGEFWHTTKAVDDEIAGVKNERGTLRTLADSAVFDHLLLMRGADLLDHERETVEELMRVDACGLDTAAFDRGRKDKASWWNPDARIATPNITAAWQRVLRFQVELELAEHVLGLRSETRSRCSDGQWTAIDGGVKFSRDLPASGPAEVAMPLEFHR